MPCGMGKGASKGAPSEPGGSSMQRTGRRLIRRRKLWMVHKPGDWPYPDLYPIVPPTRARILHRQSASRTLVFACPASLIQLGAWRIVTMAAMAATMSVTSASVRQFEGLKATTSFTKPVPSLAMRKTSGKGALGARCDYIGSPTNLIMVASTTLMLFAGRFGLAPSANRKATAGLKLVDRESGLQTGDPAGFTATDTLACGALGHVIGVGIVLGLKATGGL